MKKFKIFTVTLPIDLVEEVRKHIGKRGFSKLVRELLVKFADQKIVLSEDMIHE